MKSISTPETRALARDIIEAQARRIKLDGATRRMTGAIGHQRPVSQQDIEIARDSLEALIQIAEAQR